MEQWLQWALAVPLSGGVLSLLYRVAPVPRWTWAMKSRLAVFRDMPAGSERDWWAADAEKYSRLIREYRQSFPTSQKVLGWIAVFYTIVLLYLDTFLPWDKAMNLKLFGPFGPVITLGSLAIWIWMSISVLRGQTIFGLTSQEHGVMVKDVKRRLSGTRPVRFVGRRMRRPSSA